MRIRPLALCVVLFGAALGAAGCTSSTPSAGATSGASSTGSTPAGSSSTQAAADGKGQVIVRSGGKLVCVITLNQNGTGTCKVSTKDYKPGQVTFDGSYNGDGRYKATNASTTITVKPASQSS